MTRTFSRTVLHWQLRHAIHVRPCRRLRRLLPAGPGATKKDAARACYNLGISGGHYRLGNECDFYGEFGLAQTGTVDGVNYKAKVMSTSTTPAPMSAVRARSFEQMSRRGQAASDMSPERELAWGRHRDSTSVGRPRLDVIRAQWIVGVGAASAIGRRGKLGKLPTSAVATASRARRRPDGRRVDEPWHE